MPPRAVNVVLGSDGLLDDTVRVVGIAFPSTFVTDPDGFGGWMSCSAPTEYVIVIGSGVLGGI